MKCNVVIPVGPGHEQLKDRAINSVGIAMRTSMGPFSEVRVRVGDDSKGEHGRSATRNNIVNNSEGDWIFFLDADDLMHPWAFANFQQGLHRDAVWGKITELQDHLIVERYQIPVISDFETLIRIPPFMSLGPMGHFVRDELAKQNPFNPDMDCGEDWDYYLRMWKKYDCVKIDTPFIINYRGQHSTGPRSATGRQWDSIVHKMLEEAREVEVA